MTRFLTVNIINAGDIRVVVTRTVTVCYRQSTQQVLETKYWLRDLNSSLSWVLASFATLTDDRIVAVRKILGLGKVAGRSLKSFLHVTTL